MINIVHVLHSFGVGGLESVLASLIDNADHEKFSHSICVLSDDLAGLARINSGRPEVDKVKRMLRNDPSLVFRLAMFFRKKRPDIIRTYNWGAIEGVIAARIAGVKKIIHSEHGFDRIDMAGVPRRRIFVRSLLSRYCDRVVTPAMSIKGWLTGTVGIEKEKVVYIPNGCDTGRFRPGSDPSLRGRLGFSQGDVVMGTVGRLKAIKGHRVLMEAFFRMAHKNLKLLVVGDGPLRRELMDIADAKGVRGRVCFTGNIPDTAPYYRAMDAFVLPSLSEQAPNALLEAMASGLPIVASGVGDVNGMLDGGKAGVIVKPHDAVELARSIGALLADRKEASLKGRLARQRACDVFNLKKMVRSYEALYIGALEKGSAE